MNLYLNSLQNEFKIIKRFILRRVDSRPANDPYCQAGLVPFCPSGKTVDSMPKMDPSDIIEIYALKKPVW